MKNETKGMIFGLIGVSAFGLTLPVTRIIIPYLDPIFIGLGRAVLAAVLAAIFLYWFRQKIPTKKQMYKLSVVALGVSVGLNDTVMSRLDKYRVLIIDDIGYVKKKVILKHRFSLSLLLIVMRAVA